MWKHVAILLAAALAFGASLLMLGRFVGFASPGMMLMYFLCFLGLANFAEPIWMLRMPPPLRRLRAWELRGGVYERLAVPRFGAMLRNSPLRLLNARVYVARQRHDPQAICRLVESAEAIHFWAGILLLPILAYFAAGRRWLPFCGFLLLQIVGNLYPIMHLRSVRGRLERVCRRGSGERGRSG